MYLLVVVDPRMMVYLEMLIDVYYFGFLGYVMHKIKAQASTVNLFSTYMA